MKLTPLQRAELAEFAIARIRRMLRKGYRDGITVTETENIIDEYVLAAGLHIMQPKGE